MIHETNYLNIPSSTLSTSPNQSTPAAPTQTLPEHLEQHNASLKRNVTAEGKIFVIKMENV